MRRKPGIPLQAYLALALFPFVVGFGPPREAGTYVSVAGGTGHYLAKSACSAPEVTDYRDYQAAVGHQFEPIGPFHTRLGLGVQADALSSRSKVCDAKGCEESDSSAHDRGTYWAAGAFATADWDYIGFRVGGRFHTRVLRPAYPGAAEDWLRVPLDAGVRLGPEWLYLSGEVEAAAPLLSGGGPVAIGLGGRWLGTDLWGGYSLDVFQARVSRDFGPLRAGLTGAYGQGSADYTVGSPSNPDQGPNQNAVMHASIPQYRAAAQLEYSFR